MKSLSRNFGANRCSAAVRVTGKGGRSSCTEDRPLAEPAGRSVDGGSLRPNMSENSGGAIEDGVGVDAVSGDTAGAKCARAANTQVLGRERRMAIDTENARGHGGEALPKHRIAQ